MFTSYFPLQNMSYSCLLEVSDEEREFLTLEELKPHQLTELAVSNQCSADMQLSSPSLAHEQLYGDGFHHHHHHHQYYHSHHRHQHQSDQSQQPGHEHIYYDLNSQQQQPRTEYDL